MKQHCVWPVAMLVSIGALSVAPFPVDVALLWSDPGRPGSILPVEAEAPIQVADTAEFLRLEQTWNDAHERGDADALDRLWASDFSVTVPGMARMNRSEVMGFARSGRMRFRRYVSSDIHVRIVGGAAIVTGRVERLRTLGDEDVADDWLFTKVYARQGREWKVVVFHASERAR